ncbi:MAG TPA: MlaD family protein [Steroidobacteraceae bacterium]|nr:MlaD family protein [Steroidobacteraceae bacterium]
MTSENGEPRAHGDDRDASVRPAPERAVLRPRSWLSWVWLVPVFAASVVLWLAWRALAARGPEITIAFNDAGALQPGQTSIRYKGVDVGQVERVELTPNVSRVLVHARMSRAIEPYLAAGARFWIVQPRVGAQGISGLATLVSGAYIEMYPGRGAAERHFTGLEEPPVLQPNSRGTSLTLLSPNAGQLIPGAPITYRGIDVGEIQGYELARSRTQVEIYAFVRAPYDRLVHPQTRFWNAAGIDLTAGAQGLSLRVSSWEQLLAGGVAFDTPDWALDSTPSGAGSTFQLYDSRGEALLAPRGTPLVYRLEFAGNARGVQKGTPVELEGFAVGEVTAARLTYDPTRKSLATVAQIAIDAATIDVQGVPDGPDAQHTAAVSAGLANLIERGLRAQLVSSSLLTGQKMIALEVLPGAAPSRVQHVAGLTELPTAPAANVDAILQSVQDTVERIDRATAGPKLNHALDQLDSTLTGLNQLTAQLRPETQALVASLRATSEAAQRTAQAAGAVLGASGTQGADLPHLMQQLSDAARSIRALADYLDRHPEALLRGRRD